MEDEKENKEDLVMGAIAQGIIRQAPEGGVWCPRCGREIWRGAEGKQGLWALWAGGRVAHRTHISIESRALVPSGV